MAVMQKGDWPMLFFKISYTRGFLIFIASAHRIQQPERYVNR